MTPYQQVNVQTFLLATLRSAGTTGISEEQLLLLMRREGYVDMTAPQLAIELRSLADKSWLLPFEPPLGAKRWRITTAGQAILSEQGL
jgi:hypothetical protein